MTDPRAVPAIWQTFVKEKPARLDLAVRLLGQIDSPESSRRLVALILADPPRWESEEDGGRGFRWVGRFFGAEPLRQPAAQTAAEREASPGDQALTILRHRDPRDFLGVLVDSLQEPVTVTMQRGKSSDIRILHVESETLDWQRTYVPRRAPALAFVPGGGSVDRHNIGHDAQQARYYKASVDRTNLTASHALRELTGQAIHEPDPARARDAWRAWWADERGYSYNPSAHPANGRRRLSSIVATNSCFAAGTPVRTLLGPRPIESIRIGDQVLAQDVTTGALSFEPVLTLYHNPPKPTLRIDLGGEVIVATPIHRFWKAGQGWAMARDLRPGDTIRRLGGTAQVLSVSEEKVQPVFNLDVAQCRSFFVGASAPWCTTTASSIRSSIRSMPRRRRRPRPPAPAEGPPRGREPVADGPRSVGGRSLLMRAMPPRPSAQPCPGR